NLQSFPTRRSSDLDLSYELKENETEEDRPLIKVRKENPNYDPNKKQKPRSERPDEWTLVGLVGQVYVRIDETVRQGDYIKSGHDGIGTVSDEKTGILVMKITKEHTDDFGIARCLIK